MRKIKSKIVFIIIRLLGTVRLGWTAMIDRIIIPLSCMVEVRKVYEKTHFLDNSYYGDFNSSICDLGMAEYE